MGREKGLCERDVVGSRYLMGCNVQFGDFQINLKVRIRI